VDYPKWWANIRPSNTEPKLRLNMEADTKELLEEKKKEIELLIAGE
jgi:phosphomannomutase